MKRTHSSRLQKLFMLLLVCILPVLLHAQVDRGTINGTIKDPSGAVLPGVTVTATNVATGVSTVSVSNAQGFYSLLNLPIGRYTLRFQKTGFAKLERSGITLITSQIAGIDASLSVGSTTQAITVTDNAPVIQTETSDISADVKGSIITDLPMNVAGGRDAENFVFSVMPGVEGNPWTASINGSQNFTKDVKIDGLSITASVQGDQMEVGPTMEAVEEVSVQTSGAQAENASTAGGVEMFAIKSGTNHFHGSVFGFGHNEILDANSWSNDYLGLRKAKDRLWDWGFSAGGPVWIPKLYNGRNRTFIFGAFEKYQQTDWRMNGIGNGPTVPTQDFLNGDFSALLTATQSGQKEQIGVDGAGNPIYKGAIFDPTTGNVFPGNIIPSDRLSAAAQKIAAIYQKDYAPASGSLTNNELFPAGNSPSQIHHQYTFRVDHNLTANNRLSGDYIHMFTPRLLVDSGGVWQAGSVDGGPLANARTQIVSANTYHISDSHTFSSNLINVASIGYNRYWNGSVPGTSSDYPPTLGFGETGAGNFPQINFKGGVNGVTESNIGNAWGGHWIAEAYILNDTVTWVHGHHTIKIGGEAWHQKDSTVPFMGGLSFNFSNDQTGAPTDAAISKDVGFSFASFMLGAVQSASESTGVPLHSRRDQFSLFAQDDFQVNTKLTLNLGLRWDVTTPLTEKDGRWTVFDPNVQDTLWGIKGMDVFANSGSKSFEGSPDYRQFGPHVGFAYRATSRLVARGSYGITYNPIGTNTWGPVPYSADYGFGGTNAVPQTQNFTPAFDWDNGYPGRFTPALKDPHVTILSSVGWGQTIVDPHGLSQGYEHQFNAGLEYALTRDTRLSVNYVGNRGERLHDGNLATSNVAPSQVLSLYQSGHEWDWVSDSGSAAAAGVPYPFQGWSGFAIQALNKYPQLSEQWDGNYFINTHVGQTTYDALQIEALRRSGSGFTFDMSYVLARSLGNTGNAFVETWTNGAFQDFSNLGQEASLPTSGDARHIVKGYVTYQLPVGRGKRFLSSNALADKFIGGWEASALLRYNSGNPIFVYAQNPYTGISALYPNVDLHGNFSRQFRKGSFVPYSGGSTPPSGDRYFDSTLYSQPAPGQLGSGPEVVSANRGFGYSDEDATLLKNTTFGTEGKYRLSFRVEFYNLLNRHYYSNPNTDITSPEFGYTTGVTGNGRNGQFGTRFQW